MSHYITLRGKLIALQTPIVMGIINTTPDSFYSQSRVQNIDLALQTAQNMISEGATILDIGAVSTRPNAEDIPLQEEMDRLLVVLEAIKKEFPDVYISIDTERKAVAQEAMHLGADIINDISAGDSDADMLPYITQNNIPYIMMHKRGNPKTMSGLTDYNNVTQEVYQYLYNKIFGLRKQGHTNVIADVGFGFAKTVAQNWSLLKNLSLFQNLDVPILVGVSRKSMITKALGVLPTEALNGTSVVHTLALLNGAQILRVHDVKQAQEAIKLVTLYRESN